MRSMQVSLTKIAHCTATSSVLSIATPLRHPNTCNQQLMLLDHSLGVCMCLTSSGSSTLHRSRSLSQDDCKAVTKMKAIKAATNTPPTCAYGALL